MYKKLSLRLNKIQYSTLCGLQNLLRLRSHNRKGYSFQIILLGLIHLKTKSLRLTKSERRKLDWLSSKSYQYKRTVLVHYFQELISEVNSLNQNIHGGLINLNQLTRFVNQNKMNVDFEMFSKLSSQLNYYRHLMSYSYLKCNQMENKIGDEFMKI